MLYKIKVNPYDGRKKEFKGSSRIKEEVYKKMLKRKTIQKKITYSQDFMTKRALDQLHATVVIAVNKAFKSGIPMSEDYYFEIYF